MSAENSPILGNTSNKAIAQDRAIDSAPLISESISIDTTDNTQLSLLIDDTEAPLLPNLEAFNDQTIETENTSTSDSTTNSDEQIAEITKLQEQLLNNKEFDINDLESTSAGAQDSQPLSNTEKSTSSPLYVESDLVNLDLVDLPPASLNNTNLSSNRLSSDISTKNITQETETLTSKSNNKQNENVNIEAQVNEDLFTVREGNFENASLDAGSISSDFGTLDYNQDGSWSYTLDNSSNSVQSLGANQSISDQFIITTKSGETLELNIIIHGTNDTPIISGDTNSEVNTLSNFESGDRPETVSGKLDISDTDTSQAQFVASDELIATYGEASINESGEWSYALDSQLESVKNLKEGETLTDTITVLSKDGTSEQINITILGADDKPILSGQNSESININEQTQISEKLSIIDPDFGESSFIAKTGIQSENGFGTGSIDVNGNWNFTLNADHPKVSTLEDDAQLLDFFMVSTADGTEQSIIIRIQNNAPSSENALEPSSDFSFDAQISLIEVSDEQIALDAFNNPNTNHHQNNSTETPSNSNASIAASQLDSSLLESHIIGQSNSIDTA